MAAATIAPSENPTAVPHLERQAVRLTRGDRTIFQLALDCQTFGDRIPQSPATIPSGSQRAFSASHARGIYLYILDNPDGWAFNPIIVAANSRDVEWEPIAGTSAEHAVQNGTLRLAAGSMDRMRILDGQHRRAAIQDILRVTPSKKTASKLLRAQESLLKSVISVEVYVINDDDEVKQVFADMARQRAISAGTRAWMDLRDVYNRATVRLCKERVGVPWLRTLVPPLTEEKQSIRKGSPWWLNAAGVTRLIKIRDLGGRSLRANQRDLPEYSEIAITERLKPFFQVELPALRPEWRDLASMDGFAVALQRETTLAFTTAMPQVAAYALFMWQETGQDDLDPLAERFLSLNLSRDFDEISPELRSYLRQDALVPNMPTGSAKAVAAMLVSST